MPSQYPDALDNLPATFTGTDQADVVDHAGMHNTERQAINAIEAELGTNPAGTHATVKARLDAVDAEKLSVRPVIIGTGSPLNIVTPDFKGQEFVDTAQTLGARKWVATTLLSSGWKVSDGETPVYDVRSLILTANGYSGTASYLNLQRVTGMVYLNAQNVSRPSAGSGWQQLLILPVGFRALQFNLPTTNAGGQWSAANDVTILSPAIYSTFSAAWPANPSTWPTAAPV